ncbi:MAG TPA: sigma-54 dependent transcriptional regulator [Bryobacteraceae bacterium]|nr:sigma-54 dependent transcriptional regulator [Bryobacteraceae bacterium]
MRTALSAVLGSEVTFTPVVVNGRLWQLPSGDTTDVIILDLDSAYNAAMSGSGPFGFSPGDPGAEDLTTFFARLLATGIPVIVLAGDNLRSQAQELVERGAQGQVRNPPAIPDLKALMVATCESRRPKRDLEATRQRLESLTGLDQLTGASAPMQLVYKLIRKVANLEASVLITGESGTGKELISRAIHNTGTRARRPFVAVSCAAIPDTLIEAELFGHEKGAFTGSANTREGYFEQAGDGTLFLDEIGELKPQTQVKLLRVLQEREFCRLGSSRRIPLRARVVLATHRDLGRMVSEGGFRQDLFYRINVVNIPAPELRRRPSDIPVLAQYFLIKYAEIFGKPVESIEPEAMALLQRYPWPGNVRELENVIQRAIILAEGYSLQISDLPEDILDAEVAGLGEDYLVPNGSFERLLRDYKIKLANEAVHQCNGNKTLAAQSLSISRAYLHRLLRPCVPEPGVTEIRSHACV